MKQFALILSLSLIAGSSLIKGSDQGDQKQLTFEQFRKTVATKSNEDLIKLLWVKEMALRAAQPCAIDRRLGKIQAIVCGSIKSTLKTPPPVSLVPETELKEAAHQEHSNPGSEAGASLGASNAGSEASVKKAKTAKEEDPQLLQEDMEASIFAQDHFEFSLAPRTEKSRRLQRLSAMGNDGRTAALVQLVSQFDPDQPQPAPKRVDFAEEEEDFHFDAPAENGGADEGDSVEGDEVVIKPQEPANGSAANGNGSPTQFQENNDSDDDKSQQAPPARRLERSQSMAQLQPDVASRFKAIQDGWRARAAANASPSSRFMGLLKETRTRSSSNPDISAAGCTLRNQRLAAMAILNAQKGKQKEAERSDHKE